MTLVCSSFKKKKKKKKRKRFKFSVMKRKHIVYCKNFFFYFELEKREVYLISSTPIFDWLDAGENLINYWS